MVWVQKSVPSDRHWFRDTFSTGILLIFFPCVSHTLLPGDFWHAVAAEDVLWLGGVGGSSGSTGVAGTSHMQSVCSWGA
jgi:hypothetical protein